MNIADIEGFYTTAIGKATQAALMARLAPAIATGPEQMVLGLGFATPYLTRAGRNMAMMLARGGVVAWPEDAPNKAALVDDLALPLPDNSVDVALVVHALEFSESAEEALAEIWRVLSPQGRLVMVVANRRGFWAASDRTPFGHGQPFSRGQLLQLLRGAEFTLPRIASALVSPPWAGVANLKGMEPLARTGLGGVLIVEAVKQVHAYVKGTKARRMFARLQPVLLPGVRPVTRQAP